MYTAWYIITLMFLASLTKGDEAGSGEVDVDAEIEASKVKRDNLNAAIHTHLANSHSRIDQDVTDLLNEFNDDARDTPDHQIATTIGQGSNVAYPGGAIIKLDRELSNFNNGYDSTTGIFTCPKSGVYYFNANIMAVLNHGALVSLARTPDGTTMMNTWSPISDYDRTSSSNSLVEWCEEGDTRYIRIQTAIKPDTQGWILGYEDRIYSTLSIFHAYSA